MKEHPLKSVDLQTLQVVSTWLTRCTPQIKPGIKRYTNLLQIVNAFLDPGITNQEMTLSYGQFMRYCDKNNHAPLKCTATTFVRECSNLSKWLLAPACYKNNAPQYAITFANDTRNTEDPIARIVELDSPKPTVKKILDKLNPALADDDWLRQAVSHLDTRRGKNLRRSHPGGFRDPSTLNSLIKKKQASDIRDISGRSSKFYHPSLMPLSDPPVNCRIAKREPWEVTIVMLHFRSNNGPIETNDAHLITSINNILTDVIKEYGGYLHEGGHFAVFGYRNGSVRHPHTAVHAAYHLRDAIRSLEVDKRSIKCSFLIHSGMAWDNNEKLNHTLSEFEGIFHELLKQLIDLSYPDCIILSNKTYSIVRDSFQCKLWQSDNGSKPKAYEALKENNPLRTYTHGNSSPTLVGRKSEFEKLFVAWNKASRNGAPQIVWIQGMVGTGKSRLADEILQNVKTNEKAIALICQCRDFRQQTPFYPLREMLRNQVRLNRIHSKSEREKAAKRFIKYTARFSSQANQKNRKQLKEYTQIISMFLHSLHVNPLDDSDPSFANIQEEESIVYCTQICDILDPIMKSIARNQPVMLLIEDYQWADLYSRQFFRLFQECIAKAQHPLRLLIVITSRGRKYINKLQDDINIPIQLASLDSASCMELSRELSYKHNLELTDDEMLSLFEDSGGVPDVLQELLLDRIDQTNSISWFKKIMCESENREFYGNPFDSRYIAEKAAVLGDFFTYDDLYATIVKMPNGGGNTLIQHLDQHLEYLTESELIQTVDQSQQKQYRFSFRHIRQCLLNSMSLEDREEQHCIAAQVIEDNGSIKKPEKEELLAYHYTNAGLKQANKAIGYLLQTAKTALHHSDHQEAIRKLEKAKDLVDLTDDTSKTTRQKQSVEIYLEMARAYASSKGSNSREVRKAYFQASRHVKKIQNPILDFRAKWGLWQVSFIRGNLLQARTIAQNLLRHPASKKSYVCRLEAHHAMWVTLFYIGDMHTTIVYHFDGMAIMAQRAHKRFDYSMFTGHHAPQVCCLARGALALWLSGFIDQAMDECQAAINLAERHNCMSSQAHAHTFSSFTYLLNRDFSRALEHAEKAHKIAEDHHLSQRLLMAKILKRLCEGHLEPCSIKIDQIEHAIDQWIENNIRLFETFFRAQLAQICLRIGDINKGLLHIDQAFDVMNHTYERFYRSELFRIKGELLISQFNETDSNAKENLKSAIEVARESDSRSLELRALLGYNSHLNRDRNAVLGDTNIGSRLIKTYEWFPQETDSQDLRDVKEYLNQYH